MLLEAGFELSEPEGSNKPVFTFKDDPRISIKLNVFNNGVDIANSKKRLYYLNANLATHYAQKREASPKPPKLTLEQGFEILRSNPLVIPESILEDMGMMKLPVSNSTTKKYAFPDKPDQVFTLTLAVIPGASVTSVDVNRLRRELDRFVGLYYPHLMPGNQATQSNPKTLSELTTTVLSAGDNPQGAQQLALLPIPVIRGDRQIAPGVSCHYHDSQLVPYSEVKAKYLRDYVFDSEYVRMDNEDGSEKGFDGLLYKHKRYPHLELIVPKKKPDVIDVRLFRKEIENTNQQIEKINARIAKGEITLPPMPKEEKPVRIPPAKIEMHGVEIMIHRSDDFIKIWLPDIPTIRSRIARPPSSTPFLNENIFEEHILALAEGLKRYADYSKTLATQYGFYSSGNDDHCTFTHPLIPKARFGFSKEKPLYLSEMDHFFAQAIGAAEKALPAFEKRLQDLHKRGFLVSLESVPTRAYKIVREDADFEPVWIPLRGQTGFPKKDPTPVFDDLEKRYPKSKTHAERVVPAKRSNIPSDMYLATAKPYKPVSGDDSCALVLDTSFLLDLVHKRSERRTLLDLISLTSQLATTRPIYIPSYVADYELGRFIPEDWKAGNANTDARFSTTHMREFMAKASRMYIDEKGKKHVFTPEGGNPNIIVWWSPSQAEFYENMRTQKIPRDKMTDQGEVFCKQCARSMTTNIPVKIALSDRKFVMRQDEHFSNGRSPTTLVGRGVGVVHTHEFVSALSDAFGDKLGITLHERFGGPKRSVSKDELIAKINKGEGHTKLDKKRAFEDLGMSKEGRLEAPLADYMNWGAEKILDRSRIRLNPELFGNTNRGNSR